MILPGSTIGILGGGQLGRMLAMAAAQLGYRCHIYAPQDDSVAAEVSAAFTCADWLDRAALTRFASQCDIITYEFENVPVAPLAALPAGSLAPNTRALEAAQDRLAEKRFVEGLDGRPAAFAPVDDETSLAAAIERIGLPGILKTRREGYDGKGQWRLNSTDDFAGVPIQKGGLIYEGLVRFTAEFSVILARTASGELRFWDSAENVHEGGILARSTLPAGPDVLAQVEEARALARAVAEALDYVGVLGVELFVTRQGLIVNEIAPRVHNTGHWTQDGCEVDQFEQHIRAVAGWPLGPTQARARVEMLNLLGDEVDAWRRYAGEAETRLHLYGKRGAKPGRKMGHVNRVSPLG